MKKKIKWYHVTSYYHDKKFIFNPNIPYYLRAGEDRRTPRLCVTEDWKHSLRSIILIHRCQKFYVYTSEETPINPIKEREKLLKEKKIRSNSNDYKVLEDGVVNKEHWFLQPVEMKLVGVVEIPKKEYVGMMMGFGFCNAPNVNSFKLKKYKPSTERYSGMLRL